MDSCIVTVAVGKHREWIRNGGIDKFYGGHTF